MSDPLGGLDPTGPGGPIQEGRFGGLGRLFRRRRQHDPVLGGDETIASPQPSTSLPPGSRTEEPAMGSAAPQQVKANRGPRVAPAAIAAVVILLVGLVPVVLGFMLADTSDDLSDAFQTNDAPVGLPGPATPATTGDGDGSTAVTEPAPPVFDLFADATPAFAAWQELLGPTIATNQLILYPDYAFLVAESAGSLDRYQFRDGDVDSPTEVSVTPADDLARELFPFDQVDPAVVARLVARAPTDTGSPGTEVTHVIIESDLPFADEIVIRVYVGGGRIDATLDGRIQEVFPSS